jgi:UDP-glucuronate decarboxylase
MVASAAEQHRLLAPQSTHQRTASICMALIKRILVTGGAGFLGSHLCERLVGEGHDVLCLDNFFTSQKSNVEHLLAKPNFELIRHDVTVPINLEVDEIYNLACPAAPGHYQYNPIKTMKTSVIGSINMLGMAKRCRAKILQASTSEVYGDPEIHPQVESYRGSVNPIGPRACYDEGKRAAETLFVDYHRMNKVNVRIVRILTRTARGCIHTTDAWCRTLSARRSRARTSQSSATASRRAASVTATISLKDLSD